MKDLFYGLLFILIIFTGYTVIKNSDQKTLQTIKHDGYVVIEKENNFLYGYLMTFKYDDNIERIPVYQIYYEKYEVGDTIKINND